jgi:hypothetical protein
MKAAQKAESKMQRDPDPEAGSPDSGAGIVPKRRRKGAKKPNPEAARKAFWARRNQIFMEGPFADWIVSLYRSPPPSKAPAYSLFLRQAHELTEFCASVLSLIPCIKPRLWIFRLRKPPN